MALYLKYRPKDFSSLVGQDFVKETLKKAVAKDKTVGAYLLCGPRGTGKTSSARIFAKAVNCEHSKDGDPCNQCEMCEAINSESLVDVIEIDAASHTGVDNIREIIEKAQFRPTNANYKIYIIDEVHMLSKGAFNALLKILEEPPTYVKFILATTETHKVPETIISRCQRYDLKSISLDDIKKRLEFIAQEEKVKIDTDSLQYIAENSGGALRNAISLFEQLIVDGKIVYKEIIKNLGIVEDDILGNFLEKLVHKERGVVDDFEQLVSDGKNIKLFFKELLFYTKKVSVERLKKGEDISVHLYILDILDETYTKAKNSLDENTTFLIGVLKVVADSPLLTSPQGRGIIQENNNSFSLGGKDSGKADRGQTKEETKPQKQEISTSDIDEIFGEEDKEEPNNNPSAFQAAPFDKGSQEQPSSDSIPFNGEIYLNTLKKNGAKAMVTLSIKGATLHLIGNTLEMKFKTKFAMNSVNNPDTIALLNKGLIDMGMSDVTVKLLG